MYSFNVYPLFDLFFSFQDSKDLEKQTVLLAHMQSRSFPLYFSFNLILYPSK